MKFKYFYRRYKNNEVPFTVLQGKTIKKIKADTFTDVVTDDIFFLIKTTDSERYLLTDYPSGTITLYTIR